MPDAIMKDKKLFTRRATGAGLIRLLFLIPVV
jgi:hypothetical protein